MFYSLLLITNIEQVLGLHKGDKLIAEGFESPLSGSLLYISHSRQSKVPKYAVV